VNDDPANAATPLHLGTRRADVDGIGVAYVEGDGDPTSSSMEPDVVVPLATSCRSMGWGDVWRQTSSVWAARCAGTRQQVRIRRTCSGAREHLRVLGVDERVILTARSRSST
jgi:hypothetical protein